MTDQDERRCTDNYRSFYPPTRCTAKGKVQREGKWFCGLHDPVAVERRAIYRRHGERQPKRTKQ